MDGSSMEKASQEEYNFDAPQLYFNFSEGMQEEPDDSYFDCVDNVGDNKISRVVAHTPHALRSSNRVPGGTPKRAPLADVTPRKSQVIAVTQESKQITRTPQKPPTPKKGMQSSFQNEEEKENTPQVPRKTSLATPKTSLQVRNESSKKKKKSISPAVGMRSSPRLAAIAKALRRSNAARRSSGAGSCRTSDVNISNLSVVHKQKTQNKPSIPRVSGMKKGLNEKDYSDLSEIATFKDKIAKNKKKLESANSEGRICPTVPHEFHFATDGRLRQKNQADQNRIFSGPAPVKAVHHGPTKPQEFHFATDSRVKKHTINEAEEPLSFPEYLRSGSSVSTHKREPPKGTTIPQPFRLTESRKTGGSTELNKFVSVAELNLKFHTQTPQRFRSKRTDESDDSTKHKKTKTRSGITHPVTPELSTRTRSRQINYPTRAELEEQEFLDEQKHQFKAHPVNKKIFEAPSNVFPVKKATIPEPFNITKSTKEKAPFGDNFKEMCNMLGCSTSSLASLPWGGIPSKWEKSNTKVQPFSFDARDKANLQRKQETIQKILEDEKKLAEFHAQPMPLFEDGNSGVPLKKPPTPTRVQSFNLQSDLRGEKIRDQFNIALEKEQKEDNERRKFKATSDAVVYKQPFIPEKSKKAMTNISGFTLNTEIRAEARSEFDLHQKQREDELLAAKKEREERLAAEEAAEVARMRREAVHKANPVCHYKPVHIKPAACLPTVPVSPKFATKTRLRARLNSNTGSANSTMDISSATYTAE